MKGRVLTVSVLVIALLFAIAGTVAFAETVSNVVITVKDSDGTLVQGALVEVYDSDGTRVFSGTTDENGTVTISSISTGNYDIYVYYKKKLYHFSEKIDTGTTSITLKLGYTSQFMAAIYSYWWVLILVGAGIFLAVWFIVLPGGKRGSITSAGLFVFLMLLGLGMVTTGYLVKEGYITADNAALIGTFMVLIAALIPMFARKRKVA